MAEPGKKGLFSRLFGRGRQEEAPQPEAPDPEASLPTSTASEVAHEAWDSRPMEAPAEDEAPAEAPALAPDPDGPSSATELPEAVAADAPWPEDPAGPEPAAPEPAPVPPVAEAPTATLPLSGGVTLFPEASAPAAAAPATQESLGWFQRLKRGLARSTAALGQNIAGLVTRRKLDAETLEELEDALIRADLGVETAMAVVERLSESRYDKGLSDEEVKTILAEEIEKRLVPVAKPLVVDPARRPHVVLVVGVNGSGKTTTIGKIAARLTRSGQSVMLAAGDTFRAAAIEQLKVWGERAGAPVVSRPQGADASGLVFDAMTAARDAGTGVLLVDTAGRLQNRGELMAELEKVVRVIRKQDPTAPHDVLLVLDATTGQNALQQVEIFGKVAGVTGLAMTKLDGTARGGILVGISARFKVPVHFIGVGESVDDLAPFDPREFARAIAGLE